MATPHVPVQLLLAPGEQRTIELDLPPGRYRLRTLHPGAGADIEHAAAPFPACARRRSASRRRRAGAAGQDRFANDAGFELAALIEDRTWTREALTAPEVISLQVFRDLFAEATLRPGDEAAVGQVALLFTDLQRLDGALRAGRRCGGLQHRCASTSLSSPRSCATMTARWSRRSAMR